MKILERDSFLLNTPWWLVPIYFITSVILGLYIGVPLAIKHFDLTIPSEVNELFVLMAIVYSYYLLPLCFVAAFGYRYVRAKKGKFLQIAYLIFCAFAIPMFFYGIGVTLYYN